jgi:hypothetical protein
LRGPVRSSWSFLRDGVVVALLIELPSANLIKLLMPAPKKKTPVVEPDAGGEAPRGR